MADPKINIIIGAIADAATKNISQVNKGLSDVEASAKKGSAALNRYNVALFDASQATRKLSDAEHALAKNTDPTKQRELRGEVLKARVALDQAADAADRYGKELDDTSKSSTVFDKIKSAMVGIGVAAGIVTSAGVALKKALDMGREGAAAQQTAESFDLLMKTVGAAPDLLEQLQAASKGTISDLDLMSSTSALLAGAQGELAKSLANSTPELMEIAKAANKLNPSLGTTTHMYESLALGIKRASPMILDNLGLMIKIGDANEAYAKSIGKTVEELTAEDQKQALLNETLRAGRVLIDQVGGSTDSATDSFARMDVAVEEASLAMKMKLVPATTAFAELIAEMLTLETDTWFRDGSDAAAGFINDLFNLTDGTEKSRAELEEEAATLDRVSVLMQDAGRSAKGMGEEQEFMRGRTAKVTEAIEEEVEATEELIDVNAILKTKMSELKLFMSGPLKKANDDLVKEQSNIRDKMSEVAAKIEVLNGMEHLTDKQQAELDTLHEDYIGLGREYKLAADANDEAHKRIMFNIIEQAAAMDGLSVTEGEALAIIAEKWGLVDEETKNAYLAAQDWIGGLKEGLPITTGMVEELERAIAGLKDKKVTIDVWYSTHGYAPGVNVTIGGGGGNENPELRASGGPVTAGMPYIVGERGPELFMPKQSGTIIPNGAAPASNRLTVFGGLHLSGVESGADLLGQLNDLMIG